MQAEVAASTARVEKLKEGQRQLKARNNMLEASARQTVSEARESSMVTQLRCAACNVEGAPARLSVFEVCSLAFAMAVQMW